MQVIFHVKKIVSQRACYCYIIENLPEVVVKEFTDLLETMPEENPYTVIKQTSKFNETILHDLLNNMELDNQTPFPIT